MGRNRLGRNLTLFPISYCQCYQNTPWNNYTRNDRVLKFQRVLMSVQGISRGLTSILFHNGVYKWREKLRVLMTIRHYSAAFRDLNLILGNITYLLKYFWAKQIKENGRKRFTLVLCSKTIHIYFLSRLWVTQRLRAVVPLTLEVWSFVGSKVELYLSVLFISSNARPHRIITAPWNAVRKQLI